MKIKINNTEIEVKEDETLIETARRMGYSIPSLCYAKGFSHKSSCMVCVVKDCKSGQLIPSCSTLPTDGMEIDTESEDIKTTRILSLELLLSDHRADCQAPCQIACPGEMDVAMMNRLYDKKQYDEAIEQLRDTLVIPATLCFICNAPCERICRKGDIDKSVSIREIKKKLVQKTDLHKIKSFTQNGKKIAIISSTPALLSTAYNLCKMGHDVTIFEKEGQALTPYIEATKVPQDIIDLELTVIKRAGVKIELSNTLNSFDEFDIVVSSSDEMKHLNLFVLAPKTKQPARMILEGQKMAEQINKQLDNKTNELVDAKLFNSSYNRFDECEKAIQQEQAKGYDRPSGCLYCDCDKKTKCSLRNHSTEYGIKKGDYIVNSTSKALKRQHIKNDMWFEQAKCIKCGLCVYNSQNGFTFKDRGFGMQIVLPNENVGNVNEQLSQICPTGALYIKK